MKRLVWVIAALAAGLLVLAAQNPDFQGIITSTERPSMALPDFRGDGQAQAFMGAFNSDPAGRYRQRGAVQNGPQDALSSRHSAAAHGFPPASSHSAASGPHACGPDGRAAHGRRAVADGLVRSAAQCQLLAIGYTFVQSNLFVLKGWLMDLRRDTPANAQVLGKTYIESLDEAGARKAAHEFAADIIAQFGGKTLFGTHIYFVSSRSGHKEIWAMDPDGGNQRADHTFQFADGAAGRFAGRNAPSRLLAMLAEILVYLSFL